MWYDTNILEDHAASIFHLQGGVMEEARSSETLSYITTECHNPEDPNLKLSVLHKISFISCFAIQFEKYKQVKNSWSELSLWLSW